MGNILGSLDPRLGVVFFVTFCRFSSFSERKPGGKFLPRPPAPPTPDRPTITAAIRTTFQAASEDGAGSRSSRPE